MVHFTFVQCTLRGEAAALLEDDVRTDQRRYARFYVDYMRGIGDKIAQQRLSMSGAFI
jgi:hypothetical protein